MVAGVGCLALALGPDLSLVRGQQISLPMPADILAWLPGVSQMGTTLRFTTGLAFVLIVGLCFLVEDVAKGRGRAALFGVLIAADWVFGTVSSVPMAARSYQLPSGFSAHARGRCGHDRARSRAGESRGTPLDGGCAGTGCGGLLR